MAILNSIKKFFPGYGQVTEYVSLLAQNLPINAATALTLTGFTNFVSNGMIRFKLSAAPAASQITGIKITGTDGVTTLTLYQDAAARTAAELLDMTFRFFTDLSLTTITVTVTLANAGTAMTADLEIAGNP